MIVVGFHGVLTHEALAARTLLPASFGRSDTISRQLILLSAVEGCAAICACIGFRLIIFWELTVVRRGAQHFVGPWRIENLPLVAVGEQGCLLPG